MLVSFAKQALNLPLEGRVFVLKAVSDMRKRGDVLDLRFLNLDLQELNECG